MVNEKSLGNYYDYIARLNLEKGRKVWLQNHPKIEYVFYRVKKYLKPGMSVCEIGVGDGYLLRLLSNMELKVTGIDISRYLVEKLNVLFKNWELPIRLLQHDISNPIPELQENFDAIFALDVLEHIKDLDKAIENIACLLRPGGLLIATLPWKENLVDNIVVCPSCGCKFHRVGHFHSFHSYDDIIRILGEQFQIVEYSFIPSYIYKSDIIERLEYMLFDFLKKTIFRSKYYKDNLPNFQTTIFFIAKVHK